MHEEEEVDVDDDQVEEEVGPQPAAGGDAFDEPAVGGDAFDEPVPDEF